ncbi:MAG: hypothetical protein RR818_00615 [Citrobacter sp.]
MKTPCAECAFRRDITPGALGGSPAETYVGQTNGPFYIPCHSHYKSDTPDWKDKAMEAPQCAGSRVYRANIGMHPLFPEQLLGMEADPVLVFASHAEFVAHHKSISLADAEQLLAQCPPDELTWAEINKADVRPKK